MSIMPALALMLAMALWILPWIRNLPAARAIAGFLAAWLATAPLPCLARQAQPLPALNIDIAQTSVSGLSSGAFMAVQFQIAHSSIIKGAGIIAGGPYYCGQGDLVRATTLCSCTLEPGRQICNVSPSSADVAALVPATRDFAARGLIDPIANLARQRVFIFSGAKDPVVPPAVVRQLADYYRRLSVPADNIATVQWPAAGHTMPTMTYGKDCAVTESPYIGKCGFDGAKEILAWIYGPLRPPRQGMMTGRFIQFDQTPYTHSNLFSWRTGMDSTGWVYIPADCGAGKPCRLHIALHGCEQGQDYLPLRSARRGGLYYGTTFVKHAGYREWADANHIVVLFPQAVSIPFLNPYGCWDWWGYTDDHYATKNGMQISAIRAMVDRIASGRR